MEEPDPNNVFKKPSPEILFAEYGRSSTEGEDPTPENKRVIDLYDPVDAMSLNREKDRVVVSGIRGVLQIIKIQNSTNDLIEGPSIVKDLDMRVYRKGKVNILYSAQNVKWNQLYDQYIATTSSNGSIVCWNISRRNKSVFKSHERSATCLDWHATTPYILVSGSRDCTVKSYDMRVKDNHQLTFSDRNCESIRDVAMCKAPGFDDYFFTGDDGGVLRLWDLRQTRRWVFQKVAHRSFVSTLSLNPHNRTLIATGGGRDKMVKIWEWTGPELNRISVVETTAPLGRVAWRPDRPYHLATCASVNETSVHVWDVRRPYLPYVTYDEHRDSVTDACWPSTDFDVFMTCGKDGLVVLHNIDSGHAPISFACDVAFDITPDGTMGLAVNSEIHAKNDADLEAKMCGPKSKKAIRQIPYESFFKPIKSLVSFGVPESLTHSLPPTTFYKIAEKYLIGGVEIMQLCETNSKVARKNGLEHVAQTWRLVEALCEQAHIQEEYDRLSAEEKERVIRAWVVRKKELAEEGRRWLANLNDHYRDDVKKQVTQRLENTQHVTAFLKFSSSSESEEGSDNEKIGDGDNDRREIDKMAPDVNRNTAKKKKKKKKAIAATDFYFGAGEANFKGGKQEILHYNEFMGLRDEAYELRDEEKERRFFCKAKKQPTNDEEYEELHRELNDTEADFQAWSPMLEIYRLLLYHAEQGDMQTCAAISMVCGKRLLDAVDPYTVNGWIQCYMEMLHRLELFLVCAKIRKYCPLDSISSVSRENTTIQLAHADCDALIVNGRCTKCEALAQADCTVCRFGIVGMTFQCNVCGHCMHTDHAYQWFQKTKECAFVGCPCTCGQNTWPDMERTFIGNDEIRKGHRKFNHLEQTEPTTNRVDASRLDTDSEESPEEDIEWSTATKLIRDKFGEVPCDDWDTPWAKHLVDIYKERLRKPGDFVPKRILALTEPPVASEDDGEEEDPAAFSSKEIAEAEVRDSLFSQLQDVITEQHDNIKGTSEDEVEDREDEDRTDLVKYYLNPPPPPKNEVRVQEEQLEGSRKRKLEQIQEEDEDEEILDEEEELFEEEEEVDEEYEGEVEEVHRESSEELDDEEEEEEVMPEEEIEEDQEDEQESVLDESEEDKDEPWDENLFGDNYIKSIGPIGLQWDLKLENERVTSPTFLSAVVKEHLMDVKRFTFAGSSDEEHQEAEEEEQEESRKVDERALLNATPEKPTEREGEVLKAPAQLTYAQKALMILGMSRSELKKKKARKQNKQLAELARKMTTEKKSFYSIDVSSDEFHVSSLSDDSFSKSTRSSSSSSSSSEFFVPRAAALEVSETKICEGYNPEIERSLSADEEEESTSHDELSAQPELRLPTPHATGDLYLKRDSPSPEIVHKMKKFKKVSSSMVYSSSGGEEHQQQCTINGYAEAICICIEGAVPSPPPSSSRFSTPPVSPVSSCPSSRFSSPSATRPQSPDPVPAAPAENCDLPPPPPEPPLPGEDTPSRKSSSSSAPLPEAPIVVEPPIITSYANPIFTRITGRPPRSRPVTISGDGYDLAPITNGDCAPSAANLLFECSSLPEKPVEKVLLVNGHGSTQLISKLNDTRDHILVIDLPGSQTSQQRQRNLSVGSELFGSLNNEQTPNDMKLMQKCPPMDSDMFSSEEDLFESCQEDLNVPFFPETEDVPIIPGTRHPWETDQVYQQRLQAERAEDEAAHVVPVSEEKEKAEEVEDPIVPPVEFNKHTPMMRELAKRRRKLKLQYPKPLQPLKRVKFTEQDYDTSMKAALENLKLEAPEMSSESDFEDFVREQEVCRKCKHQVKRDKMEKQYANWLRNVTDEGQMFFAKSLSDPCAKFQLSHLDSYRTDAEKARKTAVHLLEFIKVFYFIKWEELLGPDREFVLKEVYELWEDYREKRPRICRLHFKDYQFRFFASSIATKMKEEMLRGESPQLRQSLLNYDWLHIKPCVTTIDDDPHAMDEMLDTIVLRNPNWSIEEKKAANRYWDLFGKIPLHIESSTAVVVPPLSEDQLEIIDESNYWTKKQMKQVLCRKRNYDIRLGYTRQKKNNGDLFRVQDRSRKVVNREWQMRLEKMVNETRRVDFSTSSFRVNPHEKLIYTSDEHHPWPVCQFDNGDHYVTVQPMASKRYIEFKSRIRSKFHFRRQSSLIDNSKDVEITTEKLRKLPSFKKFEPRLQKATDFKEMVSKHFKVLDRAIVKSRYELYTIMEEDDEVELIVNMLENRTVKHGKRRLDAEDIFAERRSQRERKEREAYGRMTGAKYRRELANTEKQEIEKMKIMNKHWMPALRKKIRIARKVIEIGRLMVEEDVRKWMEYQYEMTFVKKMFRKKSLVTKKDLKYSAPVVWRDAIYQLDYKEPTIIPPYVKPLTKLNEYHYKELPIYNSSSDDEDYDPDDDRPSDDSFIQFETQPDLPAVAASLQNEIRENLELADEQADEQWEYSDDSSVSTWFNDGTDDILNRLINSDYLEEHMILKERARGALGWKLCNVLKEREPLDSESDEEENESFEYMVQTDLQKQIDAEDQWMEENAVLQDVGITDGKRTKQLAKLEHDQDMKRMERREDHQKEAQQVRWFLKKFALDHSYMTEPYTWHEDLHSAISSLHRSELRRVSNRVHLIMKSEYEELAEHDEMIADIIPRDETSIQYKMINFLLFRSNGESFEESSRRADECRDMIKPVQQYELFFGREGTYTLNMVQKEVMMMKNIRASFNYLIRRLGTNEGMPEDSVRKFMKLWWYNSRDTLERFITCCEETVETEEMIMDDMMDLYYTPGNLEIARDTFDKLEIASIMNEILYTVDQYVEETEILFRGASTAADRQAFAVMSIWEWNELKHGYPEWREPAAVSSEDPELISSESSCLSESDDPSVHSSQVSCGEESEELPESPEKSPIKIPRRISELDENDESRRNSLRKGSPNKQMMKYYSEVYESLKAVEAQRRDKKAEEAARRCMDRWEVIEREQRWEIEDKERKIHDYLMMEQAVMEKFGEEQEKKENLKNWKEILKNPEAESTQLEDCMMYGRSGIPTAEVLEMMGIPLSLDRDMFYMEMYECQSAATSVSDADELRELIEKDFKEEDLEIDGTDMDDDAVSYSSVKHVFKHELYFQRDLESRRVPSGILIFTPEQFFEDELDSKLEYEKWRRIIEASECPFTFNTLVMRERLLGKCREAFKQYLLDRYLYPEEHRNSVVLEIFKNCFVIVVVDTHLEPWDCRVVSRDDVTKAVADRASWLRQWMVQDSQERMIQWMTSHKIDMEVYASCPVLSVRGGDLTHEHIEQMSRMFIEESTREEWLSIKRHEGVQALDTIIRMPPPPSSKINAYKLIFKPIYDAWYHLWKFENQQSNSKTIIARKFDPVKEYLHKARMIVNYAHQHYRMKRFDSLMSKDPTEFQLVDRSDVPSASLFDSLDAAVSKFCNEDSPHLAEDQKQVVKDTLIQLATGKIPYFTTNYFGGYDYTENISLTEEDEENDDDKSPVLRNTDIVQPAAPNAKYLEMEDCEEEIEWLRSMHEGSDFHRRRFMAVLMYKMAQKAIFRFAPHLADFERGRKRFQHLLTLHAKQRPLLDMMITKVRGTYFMPLETNMFLYDSKLITFAELVDSEVHPKEWKERKETFEEIRRQTPKDPKSMSRFLNMHNSGSDSDSGSEVRSDSSSSLGGSTESLNSSKKGKRARRAMNKAQRELMLLKLRSKPVNPEETFALEKRAIGAKKWKVRRKINEMLEGIADLDKFKIEAKLPAKKKDLLKHINELIVENSDTAHWSWGDLKMQTRIRKIPPANRMKPKHINRILKGKKMYKPPKKYDPKDAQTNGRKWF